MVNGTGYFHAVRFYYDSHGLCQIIADFVAEGLNAGQPAVIVATPLHAARIDVLLGARGFDMAALKRTGDFVVKNASEALAKIMNADSPDPARFQRTVAPMLTAAASRGTPVRVYGEMVDLLWKAGDTHSAQRLETFWNDLAAKHSFVLLCGYALEGFTHSTHISEICSHHTHIVTATGDVALAH
jgi:MEDS: MEthanogen/methylotroph, DcmR Sensory domain